MAKMYNLSNGTQLDARVFTKNQQMVLNDAIKSGIDITPLANPMLHADTMETLFYAIQFGKITPDVAATIANGLAEERAREVDGNNTWFTKVNPEMTGAVVATMAYKYGRFDDVEISSEQQQKAWHIAQYEMDKERFQRPEHDLASVEESLFYDSRVSAEMVGVMTGNATIGIDVLGEYAEMISKATGREKEDVKNSLLNDQIHKAEKLELAATILTRTEYEYYTEEQGAKLLTTLEDKLNDSLSLKLFGKMLEELDCEDIITMVDKPHDVKGMALALADKLELGIADYAREDSGRFNGEVLTDLVILESRAKDQEYEERNGIYRGVRLDNDTLKAIIQIGVMEKSHMMPRGTVGILADLSENNRLNPQAVKRIAETIKEYDDKQEEQGVIADIFGYSKDDQFLDKVENILEQENLTGEARLQFGKMPFGNIILSDGTKIPKRSLDRDTRIAVCEAIERGYGDDLEKAIKNGFSPDKIRLLALKAKEGIDIRPVVGKEFLYDKQAIQIYLRGQEIGIDVTDRLRPTVYKQRDGVWKAERNPDYLDNSRLDFYLRTVSKLSARHVPDGRTKVDEALDKCHGDMLRQEGVLQGFYDGNRPQEYFDLILNPKVENDGIAAAVILSSNYSVMKYPDDALLTTREMLTNPEKFGLSDSQVKYLSGLEEKALAHNAEVGRSDAGDSRNIEDDSEEHTL